MRVYVTGAKDRQKVEELAFALRQRGFTAVTPFDVVDDDHTEQQALIARLTAVLECEQLITTAPTDGAWSDGAPREVAVARQANITILPAVRALDETTTT